MVKPATRYWASRVPAANPNITDPIWPGDPFWRSKKYPRELRAAIAHEWHHSPDSPSLHSLAAKYGVPNSSLTVWCYAYPFGSRSVSRRNYSRHVETNYYQQRDQIDAALTEYVQELRDHTPTADPTWWIMGDPLPSRCAKNIGKTRSGSRKITLPPLPLR